MSYNGTYNLMLLHVHKEKLDILDISNEFIEGNEHRITVYTMIC